MHVLSQVFAVALLLTLSAAAPTTEDCAPLTEMLQAQEMHMILGKWTLHAAYISSDYNFFSKRIQNTTGGHSEIIPSENNQTIIFKQSNMVGQVCIRYSINFTLDGNKIHYTPPRSNSTNEVDFLKACDGCLLMRYSINTQDGKKTAFLLLFHKTAVVPLTDMEKVGEQAECLGFSHPPQFSYKQEEVCPDEGEATEA